MPQVQPKNRKEMLEFNLFIENLELIDIHIAERKYT